MISFKGKVTILGVSFAIALYAVVGSFLATHAQQPINDAGAQMRIFGSVLQHIQNDYVDEPDWEKVRAGALRGLPSGLDAYSSYLTEEQVKNFSPDRFSRQAGIGAEFSQVSSYLYIVSVISGSPADKADLRAGDVVEFIENKATRDISLYDAKELLHGNAGTEVRLRVFRAGERPKSVKVTRGLFTAPRAELKTASDGIPVIKVHSISNGEAESVRRLLESPTVKGKGKVVLDLRNVAFGEIGEAAKVANLFIKEGELAQVIGRENKVIDSYSARPEEHVFSGEVVVLVDGATAGAGEVVASAFLERKRGEVVGEKTFGAGSGQELFPMKRGDGLLLTTRKWASAAGVPFLGSNRSSSGIKPSVEVKSSEDVDLEELVDSQNEEQPAQDPMVKPKPSMQEDLPLKKALEILSGKR
jgi:carboxyl-terminal processing protease